MSEPRQGWRWFRCTEERDDDTRAFVCGHEWREPTRDIQSPSGVDCPICGGWCTPHQSELDTALPVDGVGNLIDSSQP